MPRRRLPALILAAALYGGAPAAVPPAAAHAFPEHQVPGAGTELHRSPGQVRIRFNAKIEPVFSAVTVKDAQGRQVSRDSAVDPHDAYVLEAGLPSLGSGEYHVYWHVVARDGHRTEGDYTFTIRP